MSAFDLAQARALLARTPGLLDAWLRDLPDAWLDADEGPRTWSPRMVVAHLSEGERSDWLPRIRHMLAHGDAVAFEPFDRTAHLKASCPSDPIATLLDTFSAARARSLRELDALDLTAHDLERRGLHPELGPVTLAQHLATWTAHDLSHVAQIARVMARRYGEAVGPWKAYLGVMSR